MDPDRHRGDGVWGGAGGYLGVLTTPSCGDPCNGGELFICGTRIPWSSHGMTEKNKHRTFGDKKIPHGWGILDTKGIVFIHCTLVRIDQRMRPLDGQQRI